MLSRLDRIYLNWLYSLVERDEDSTYVRLLSQMYRTPFIFFVPYDDNRADDGIQLRKQFIRENGFDIVDEWFDEDCSVLEAIIGLANRMSYQSDETESEAFWHILRNLGIDESFDDDLLDPYLLDDILNRFIWRNYDADGFGGLFPLEDPHQDQRDVELIYQMYAYVIENDK